MRGCGFFIPFFLKKKIFNFLFLFAAVYSRPDRQAPAGAALAETALPDRAPVAAVARDCLADLLAHAGFTHLRLVLAPMLAHASARRQWADAGFQAALAALVLASVQPPLLHVVLRELLGHLDAAPAAPGPDAERAGLLRVRGFFGVLLVFLLLLFYAGVCLSCSPRPRQVLVMVAAGAPPGPAVLGPAATEFFHVLLRVARAALETADDSPLAAGVVAAMAPLAAGLPPAQLVRVYHRAARLPCG